MNPVMSYVNITVQLDHVLLYIIHILPTFSVCNFQLDLHFLQIYSYEDLAIFNNNNKKAIVCVLRHWRSYKHC